jgi:hypothetical protein
MSPKKTRKRFSLEIKYKIVKLIEEKTPFDQIINQFKEDGIELHNVYKFKSQKTAIIKEFESSTSSHVKSFRKAVYPELEQKLLEFVSTAPSAGLPISTLLLKEKALEIAKTLNISNFNASNGFIGRFKKRNEVIFKTFHGEADGVPDELCDDWVNTKLPELVKDYEPKDVFNGDEFGLFWRIPPNKSYVLKDQKFKSGKKSKQRITVFVCANSLGEKLKPIVIGKSKNPRCFRGKSSLPVIYRNNDKSWMTTEIWTEFLRNLNKKMRENNRKIALIVDNCSVHSLIPLSNVKIVFLPPNATSRLQAMDLGVIHAIKADYRRRIVRRFLTIFEAKKQFTVNDIDLYEAIIMLTNAWNELNPLIIQNCFIKSGVKITEDILMEVPEQELSSEEEPQQLSDWSELTRILEIQELPFNEFVRFDDYVVSEEQLIEDFESSLTQNSETTEQNICDSNEDEDILVEEPLKVNDAINAINVLRKFMTQTDCSKKSFDFINDLENEIYSKRCNALKQSKITDFFD